MKRAVVLLSGGLDSTTCLAEAIEQGFLPTAVSFDYSQRHRVELTRAREVATLMGVETHYMFTVGLFKTIGGSALTDTIDVPSGRTVEEMVAEVPVTYVPARNTVFLSYALGVAERIGAHDVFIGVNALDYSGYPDCRPEYVAKFVELANLATKAGVEGTQRLKVHTPLIDLTKADIVRRAMELNAPMHLTHSCYAPADDGRACGVCDSCLLRLEGFREAGVEDPIRYVQVA